MTTLPVQAVSLISPIVALGGYEIGVGRTVPTAAVVLGLISVVAGAAAVTARVRSGGRRVRAGVALVLGPIGVVVGGIHAANAAGGLGTGNGLAGALFAVPLGLVGTGLGAISLARSRRFG